MPSNTQSKPSYDTLFGSQDYYTIDPARSFTSPAAYLNDMLRQVDKFIELGPGAISLNRRRPDIKSLNTGGNEANEMVSKLTLVNKNILDAFRLTEGSFQNIKYPLSFPYNQSLTEITTYLAQNNLSLIKLRKELVFDKSIDMTAPEALGISKEQWIIISDSKALNKTGTELVEWYGFENSQTIKTNQEVVESLTNVSAFLLHSNINHNQLRELLFEDLSAEELKDELNKGFYINPSEDTKEKPIGIDLNHDPSKDTLTNLTVERLSRINRFIRLANHLDWSFTDLDWALQTIYAVVNNELPNKKELNKKDWINDKSIPYLVWMITLKDEKNLTINQCCALIGTLKDFGKKSGQTFFEQIFDNLDVKNPPQWKNSKGGYRLKWEFPSNNNNPQNGKNEQITNALEAALQVSRNNLVRIASLLPYTVFVANSQNIWVQTRDKEFGKNPIITTPNSSNITCLYSVGNTLYIGTTKGLLWYKEDGGEFTQEYLPEYLL